MKESDHPSAYINRFLQARPNISEIELGIYKYEPEILNRPHAITVVDTYNVFPEYNKLVADLNPGEEIAFHSRVAVGNRKDDPEFLHIPLVDFTTKNNKLVELFCKKAIIFLRTSEALIVNSGNSFHAYFPTLITSQRWEQFLWFCFNHPNQVDTRWVWHQSVARYSALRWSSNTKQSPIVVENISRKGNSS